MRLADALVPGLAWGRFETASDQARNNNDTVCILSVHREAIMTERPWDRPLKCNVTRNVTGLAPGYGGL
jgi:hypothetical protein